MNEEKIFHILSNELFIRPVQVKAAAELLDAGNTVPFIRLVAFVVAFGLFVAFMCVPTAILLGWVPAPMGTAEYAMKATEAGIVLSH